MRRAQLRGSSTTSRIPHLPFLGLLVLSEGGALPVALMAHSPHTAVLFCPAWGSPLYAPAAGVHSDTQPPPPLPSSPNPRKSTF